MGVLKKTIIPLALVGYEMIMAKKAPKRQLGAKHLLALYHLISNAHSWKTVNFLHSGHCMDLELVSSLVRVRNSGGLYQSNVCKLFLPGI